MTTNKMQLLLAGGVLKLGSIDAVCRALGGVPSRGTLWNVWRGVGQPSRKTVAAIDGAPEEWYNLGVGWADAIEPSTWDDPDRRYIAARRARKEA
jgi:hypothetical protein